MKNDDKDITLQMVMEHISKMKYDLEKKIDGVEHGLEKKLKTEIGSLARELKDFREEFRAFAKDVDDLDERVQEIESERLPKRMKSVEIQLGIVA